MRIEKEYDVQGLADKVKGCIKTVCETKSRNVSLDIITAQEIVDVLETVASWENKRTKLSEENEEILIQSCQNCFGMYDMIILSVNVVIVKKDAKENVKKLKIKRKHQSLNVLVIT